ncbi:hypothetical protein [Novosphingobium beihaiensis]|uniref:Uncharacterized protein n=1 Tax=Novosphingobium beihaiensis TaxID=2930389 RepID=A0ABT0BJX6_9SPHN|nr:hypothetical protein [Novosphingobium beihaiensis]MCJ2185273.1 hypothetical protein [Novosphingobium beihaiensis]
MRKIHFAGLSALALLATPVVLIAQDMPPPDDTQGVESGQSAMPDETMPDEAMPGETMPPESSGSMDAPDDAGSGADLTPGQQAELATWPAEVKSYYASLAPDRQKAFWALSPDQRAQVAALPAEQQEQVWASIMQQLSTLQAGAGQSAGPDESSSDGTPLAQGSSDAAVPPQAMNKAYPLCSKSVQDECRNPSGA